jgi:hypothetical protein
MMDKRAFLLDLGTEYLEKEAVSNDLLMAAGGATAAAATVLGASLLNASYGRQFRKDIKGMKPATASVITKLKRTAGLSKIPHHELKDFNNAFYLPPNSLPMGGRASLEKERASALADGRKREAQTAKKLLEADASPHGGIFYGKKLKNPYVVAHEIGHALADNEPALQRYVERSPAVLNKLFGLGVAAGAVTGAIRPDWIPQIGVGLAGLGALSTAADVYSEHKATSRGLDLLQRAKLDKNPRRGRAAMETAGKTYLWPAMGAKVLAPLAAAGAAKLISGWGK